MSLHISTEETRDRRDSPSTRRGLTIIELLVAVAIVAIWAGISVPALSTTLKRSKVNSTRAEMDAIGKSMRAYAEDRGFDSSDLASWARPDEHTGAGSYPTVLGDELENDHDGVGLEPCAAAGLERPYITGEPWTPGRRTSVPRRPSAPIRSMPGSLLRLSQSRCNRRRRRAGDAVRVVELISGGPDRTINTEDDLSMTVYRGPVH